MLFLLLLLLLWGPNQKINLGPPCCCYCGVRKIKPGPPCCCICVVVGSDPEYYSGTSLVSRFCYCWVQSGKLIRDLLVILFVFVWGPIRKSIPGPPCCCIFVIVVVVVGSNPEKYSGTSLVLRWYIAFLLLLGDSNSELPRGNGAYAL